MKIRMILMLVSTIILIIGCNSGPISEKHKVHREFLVDKGWEIKKSTDVETYTLDIPIEALSNYHASRITFLDDYIGEEVTVYTYELKQKDNEGNLITYIYEVEDEIIGGYGKLPGWTPGGFNLDDKERLINEDIISENNLQLKNEDK
nr:DUF4830 domain-containing protein [Paenibacillus bovis]